MVGFWVADCNFSLCPHMEEGSRYFRATAVQSLSRVPLFSTPWTVARQPPLSMGFPRQEYWSELPFPTPGTLPNPGIKPTSLMSPALASGFFATPWTVAHQAPLSMEFSKQEYWSRLPFPTLGDLPNPGTEPTTLVVSCVGRWILYHWCHLGSPLHRIIPSSYEMA